MVPDISDDILESYEEHHVADVLCTELAMMSPDHDRFDAKTAVLIESVLHHIEEEETGWFPTVREALGRKELQALGEDMLAMRAKAPTSPAQPSALKKALTPSSGSPGHRANGPSGTPAGPFARAHSATAAEFRAHRFAG